MNENMLHRLLIQISNNSRLTEDVKNILLEKLDPKELETIRQWITRCTNLNK